LFYRLNFHLILQRQILMKKRLTMLRNQTQRK